MLRNVLGLYNRGQAVKAILFMPLLVNFDHSIRGQYVGNVTWSAQFNNIIMTLDT